MIERKKKLRLIQFFLLFVGLLIIYLTYYGQNPKENEAIISKSLKEKVSDKDKNDEGNAGDKDIFFNVEYTGLDLNGNRYILKAEEAYLDDVNQRVVIMKIVNAIFYFKDNTTLYVWADNGIYNNQTFDMEFENNVKANYQDSVLFSGKAEYSNSKSFLSIYDNVRINDKSGNLIADKLYFDITKEKLNISSINNGRVNANIKLNEKRF